MYLKTFFQDYLLVFSNPALLLKPIKVKKRQNLLELWYLIHGLWFSMVVGFTLSTMTYLIPLQFGYNTEQGSFIADFIQNNPYWYLILFTAIIAPLSEETAFRLLQSTSKYLFSAGLIVLILFIFTATGFNYLFFLLLALTIPLIAGSLILSEQKVKEYITGNFRLIVLGSTALFALAHLSNFENYNEYWYLIPVFVWTQFFSGTVYSMLRIRLGFEYGIALHALFNGVVVTFMYFAGPFYLFR